MRFPMFRADFSERRVGGVESCLNVKGPVSPLR